MPSRSNLKCVICLDVVKTRIQCRKRHAVCSDCFPKYVDSLCENYPKLKSNKFKVRCPYPKCTSAPFTDSRLKHALNPPQYQRLKEIIGEDFATIKTHEKVTTSEDTSPESTLVNQLLDALNLKCPKCLHVVDHSPDGCAAMVCLHCAACYCWLCFTQTTGDAHLHVLTCRFNATNRSYFPSQALKDIAHKAYRIKALTALLLPQVEVFGHATLLSILQKVSPSLQRCNISVKELCDVVMPTTSSSIDSNAAIHNNKKKRGARELRMLAV